MTLIPIIQKVSNKVKVKSLLFNLILSSKIVSSLSLPDLFCTLKSVTY